MSDVSPNYRGPAVNQPVGDNRRYVTQPPDPAKYAPGSPYGPPSAGGRTSSTYRAPGGPRHPVTSKPAPELTPEQRSARAQFAQTLEPWGLGSLADWALNQFIDGVPIDQIYLNLRQTDEYKARFPGMAPLAANGRAISEAAYIDLERQYASIFRAANFPPGFWDSPDDFGKFIGAERSPNEIARLVNEAYVEVQVRMPPEVRDYLRDQYGPGTDAALAAWVLDPSRPVDSILQDVRSAQAGGAGRMFGFEVDRATAEQVGQLVDFGGARAGFGQLDQLRPLFDETISERDDLVAEREGVGAVFGTQQGARETVERRRESRQASTAGGGGAAATNRGITGLGGAQR